MWPARPLPAAREPGAAAPLRPPRRACRMPRPLPACRPAPWPAADPLAAPPPRACSHHPRRRRRHAPLPADQEQGQARRAHRRRLPPDRRAHEQLHQQRHQPHLHPHPVQLHLAQPPPPARVQPRARHLHLPGPVRGGAGRQPDARRHDLVLGHRRRRAPVLLAARRHQEPQDRRRCHPVWRPPLPHGLPQVCDRAQAGGRRHHHRRHPLRPREVRGRRAPPARLARWVAGCTSCTSCASCSASASLNRRRPRAGPRSSA
jgi:hypothetical protein